jgi:hypothetical protein
VILADLQAAEQAVLASGTVGHGRLRLAAFATATTWFVAPALGAMRRRHPELRLTLYVESFRCGRPHSKIIPTANRRTETPASFSRTNRGSPRCRGPG